MGLHRLRKAYKIAYKTYKIIDREGLWIALRLNGPDGKLLKGLQSFYVNSSACDGVGNNMSDWLVKVRLCQECVMLLCYLTFI